MRIGCERMEETGGHITVLELRNFVRNGQTCRTYGELQREESPHEIWMHAVQLHELQHSGIREPH